MKIIHTGDIHIGSAMQTLPPAKAKLRQMELLDHFRSLCAYAKEESVTAVLIAGDLFDDNYVDGRVLDELFFIIEQAAPVAFYYAQGNHDEYIRLNKAPENFYTFSNEQGWTSYQLSENVVVTGANTYSFRQELFESLRLEKERFHIVILHGNIYAPMEKDGISLTTLKEKNIDYLALGHIHKTMRESERLDGRGKYRYCGCLEARGFDECGEHGFFLLELQDGKLQSETFKSFSKRKVWDLKADVTSAQSYYDVERIATLALQEARSEDIIKLTLVGAHEVTLKKDKAVLSERLNDRYFFVKIYDESKPVLDLETLKTDVSEKGEFVRIALQEEMDEAFLQEVLEVGLKAFYGEEIDV